MLGIHNRGCRMIGRDDTTELWWPTRKFNFEKQPSLLLNADVIWQANYSFYLKNHVNLRLGQTQYIGSFQSISILRGVKIIQPT